MHNKEIKLEPFEMAHQEFPIIITEKAKAMAERATKAEGDNEKLFLRISVRGGGCAGLQYNLDIDDQSSHFDVWSQFGELKIASDVFSLRYLANTTVDYQETLEGAGFKFDNPNARRTCGCGSSFS